MKLLVHAQIFFLVSCFMISSYVYFRLFYPCTRVIEESTERTNENVTRSFESAKRDKDILVWSSAPFDTQQITSDGITVVVPTYRRWQILQMLVVHYAELDLVKQIVIVWNDNEIPAPNPATVWAPSVASKVLFVVFDYFSPANRFYLKKQPTTPAVAIVDDDMYISHSELRFLYRVWLLHPEQIVGISARHHVGNNYETTLAGQSYSIIITKIMLVSTEHVFNFARDIPDEILQEVTLRSNCEDIAFNFYVSHLTELPPVYVHVDSLVDFGTLSGVSSSPLHSLHRTECLKIFSDYYPKGTLSYSSLMYSQTNSAEASKIDDDMFVTHYFEPNKIQKLYMDIYGVTHSTSYLLTHRFIAQHFGISLPTTCVNDQYVYFCIFFNFIFLTTNRSLLMVYFETTNKVQRHLALSISCMTCTRPKVRMVERKKKKQSWRRVLWCENKKNNGCTESF